MKYVIGKSFTFEAAHSLGHLPPGHKCSRPHGHSYTVTLVLVANDLRTEFVVDYGDLGGFRDWIDTELDHHDLNDVLSVPTSAENLARYIYDTCMNRPSWQWPTFLHTVVVQETRKTMAAYSMDEPIVWTA